MKNVENQVWNALKQIAENNGLKFVIADDAHVNVRNGSYLFINGISINGNYYKIVLDTYSNMINDGEPLSKFIYGVIRKGDFYDIDAVFYDFTVSKAKEVSKELMSLAKANKALNEYLQNTKLNREIFFDLIVVDMVHPKVEETDMNPISSLDSME